MKWRSAARLRIAISSSAAFTALISFARSLAGLILRRAAIYFHRRIEGKVVAVRASRPFPVDRGCADCPIRKMKIHREIRVSNDKFDLTGKVAIIVGGTQGMGLTIAEMFAASGARIMICSRQAADTEAVSQ